MHKNYELDASKISMRGVCSSLLRATRAHVELAQEEFDLGGKTTLTKDQYHELLEYRKALREVEKHPHFPSYNCMPAVPGFLDIRVPSFGEFDGMVYKHAFQSIRSDIHAAEVAGIRSSLRC